MIHLIPLFGGIKYRAGTYNLVLLHSLHDIILNPKEAKAVVIKDHEDKVEVEAVNKDHQDKIKRKKQRKDRKAATKRCIFIFWRKHQIVS